MQQVAGDADDMVAIVKELVSVNTKLQTQQEADGEMLQQAFNEVAQLRAQLELASGSSAGATVSTQKSLFDEMQAARLLSPAPRRLRADDLPSFGKGRLNANRSSQIIEAFEAFTDPIPTTTRTRAVTFTGRPSADRPGASPNAPTPRAPSPKGLASAAGERVMVTAFTQTEISIDDQQAEQYRKVLKMKKVGRAESEEKRKLPRREGSDWQGARERSASRSAGRSFPYQLFEEYVKIVKDPLDHSSSAIDPDRELGGEEQGFGRKRKPSSAAGLIRASRAPPEISLRQPVEPFAPPPLPATAAAAIFPTSPVTSSATAVSPAQVSEEAEDPEEVQRILATKRASLRRKNSKTGGSRTKLKLKSPDNGKGGDDLEGGEEQAQEGGDALPPLARVPSARTFSFQYLPRNSQQGDPPSPLTPTGLFSATAVTPEEGAAGEDQPETRPGDSEARDERVDPDSSMDTSVVLSRSSSLSARSVQKELILGIDGEASELRRQLAELELVVNQLWTRLNNADTVRLNRSMRKAFDIRDLTTLSNGMIDNIMSEAENVSLFCFLFLFFAVVFVCFVFFCLFVF